MKNKIVVIDKFSKIIWSQFLKKISLFIFLSIWITGKCNCSDFSLASNTIDTTIQNSSLRVLKINPFQLFLGELPVSWEVFRSSKKSTQFQIGILIPYLRTLPSGVSADLQDFISYRTMPYLSYGISSKVELRKYGKKRYFALQGMLKYSAYSNITVTIWDSDATYESFDQVESKKSIILGLGFMIGKQTYEKSIVIDRYWGFGLRLRNLDGNISQRNYPSPRGRIEMNKPFSSSSFYPFLNLGVRIGYTFHNAQKHQN
jgi:hypothetical protein